MRPTVVHQCLIAALTLGAAPALASAQQPAVAAPPSVTLRVGDPAPDFELRGATRYGVLANPVRLSDFRDQTVVIAFFYKARTKG